MKVALTTGAAFVRALDAASSIALGAYLLRADGAVARALERAADRGADVTVTLEGEPAGAGGSPGLREANRSLAQTLAEHGAHVRLAGRSDERVHLKAAVVDGTAFLDDRNWPSDGGDTVAVTKGRAEVAAVAAALRGVAATTPSLATEKAPALGLEAAAIAKGRGAGVDVETESFGATCVSAALRARAAGGSRVRLILAAAAFAHATPRERSQVAKLAAEGIEVRLGRADQKLCVAGDRAWVGSANATYSPAPMLDWGLQTRNSAVRSGLAAAFARDWDAAKPLAQRFSVASQDGTA